VTRRTINQLLDDARGRIQRVGPAEAYAAARRGALLIDTRCAELRRRDGIIPGAVHVPLSVLFWRMDRASGHDDAALSRRRTRRVLLFCEHGYSSSLAAATLREMGFTRASDVVGGFQGWVEAGLPVERDREPGPQAS
jgi:rhodanese-related sulfurtransferase